MKRLPVAATVAALVAGPFAAPAHATFVLDTSCGQSKCAAGTMLFLDNANKDVSTFTATVGGHTGPAVTVDTTGNVDTGAGFATITPVKGGTLTNMVFTPADNTLFSDFSFRGQLEPAGYTGIVDVTWTDSTGTTGTVEFKDVAGPSSDFARLGIVSLDGETLASVAITTPGSESFKEVKQVEFSFATPVPVPAPAGTAVLAVGLLGLLVARRRKASS